MKKVYRVDVAVEYDVSYDIEIDVPEGEEDKDFRWQARSKAEESACQEFDQYGIPHFCNAEAWECEEQEDE